MIALTINDKRYRVDVGPEVPLLWVIREHLQLSGTKFSCGAGLCGACTVHMDGEAVRSCQVSLKEAEGKKITTIEGVPPDHPVKLAWIKGQVPQCGYCQPGQIMQATAFLAGNPDPTEEEITAAMDGNLCRCGTYQDIKQAVKSVSQGRKRS